MIKEFVKAIMEGAPKDRFEFKQKFDGSNSKSFDNPEISAGGYWLENFEDKPYLGQFVPLNICRVNNRSNNRILVRPDQLHDREIVINPNGSDVINQSFTSLKIENLESTVIDAKEIDITVMKDSIDSRKDKLKFKRALWGV